jgi:hypothetical protein
LIWLFCNSILSQNDWLIVKRSILIIFLLICLPALLLAQRADSVRNKIAPSLRIEKSFSDVRVLVKDKAAFKIWLDANLPGVNVKEQGKNTFRISTIASDAIKILERSQYVIYIDRAHRTPKEERALGEFDFTLNKISTVRSQYETLNGEGLVVSIKEKPFDQFDIDLKNRVVINDQFDETSTQHATVMATIAVGAGNSEPSGRGAAPAAYVTTSDFIQLSPDDGTDLTSLGVTVQNHSYGVGVENYYGIESNEYDKQCQDYPTLVHVFSSGNDGDKADVTGAYAGITGFANLTGQFKTSKNTISVGSSDRFGNVVTRSSRGPAQDGRVKPELIAYGDAGSSDAAAVVSGIALLIQQSYNDQEGSMPPSSLLKAILANSADDSGRPAVDFETGFGNADALGAIRTIEQNNFFLGNASQNDEEIHTINLPSGVHQLKATLVWNDREALPDPMKALVNDLDFELVHVASGNRWKPWVLSHYPLVDSLVMNAKRKADHLNTIEQITIELPTSGDYELHVKGYDIPQGPQAYSIAFEYESGFEWINPVAGTALVANKNTIVRWRWSEGLLTGKLEFKYVDESNWIEIANEIDMGQQYFQWITPDTVALAQLRITANSEIFESDIFPISKPINVKVGFNCSDETMLLWESVPTAQQYQLYRLGDFYLEPLPITSDTFTILDLVEREFIYYAVAPVIQGVEGIRDATRNYLLQGAGCYVVSFLPQQYIVTDNAVFDLKVGTTYGLDSITLERLDNGVFNKVQTIKPITSADIILTDAEPKSGTNIYRVRINRSNGQVAYSNNEEIVYVRKHDIFIFPNPVLAGESSSVIVDDDETVFIRVYDFLGRPVQELDDSGAVKTIDTTTLIKGTYIIEVTKSNGARQIGRLIVW